MRGSNGGGISGGGRVTRLSRWIGILVRPRQGLDEREREGEERVRKCACVCVCRGVLCGGCNLSVHGFIIER